MPARRRITDCSPHDWRSAASPAAPTWSNARRASPARTAPTSIRPMRWPTPPGGFHILQQSLQVPRRLLHDARADRGRAQTARTARADTRQHRPHPPDVWTRRATASATSRPRAPAWRRSSACGSPPRWRWPASIPAGLPATPRRPPSNPTLIALRDMVEFDFRPGLPNTLAEMELELTDGQPPHGIV